MGEPLARKLFVTLEKSPFHRGLYLVLNDGNYLSEIWAESEAEAIEIFENGGYQK